MKHRVFIIILLIFIVYVAGYIWFRNTHIQAWEQNGQAHVIFTANRAFAYYLYRPLTYVDGFLTGMRFHAGPHR